MIILWKIVVFLLSMEKGGVRKRILGTGVERLKTKGIN